MLKKNSFSKGYGLITDYIAAVLHALRNDDRTALLNDYAKFDGSLSERDHLAICKTFSGMMKLVYPDGKITDEEAKELIDFSAEGRKRVKDQLYVIDSTFCSESAKFEYTWLKTGETIKVETLENIEHRSIHTMEDNDGQFQQRVGDAHCCCAFELHLHPGFIIIHQERPVNDGTDIATVVVPVIRHQFSGNIRKLLADTLSADAVGLAQHLRNRLFQVIVVLPHLRVTGIAAYPGVRHIENEIGRAHV